MLSGGSDERDAIGSGASKKKPNVRRLSPQPLL